jgi:3-methyladenine DNA glycosylase/8-oxoguanine DNA glycosylase
VRLAPNAWGPAGMTLARVLSLPGGPARVVIRQGAGAGDPVRWTGRPLALAADRALDARDRLEARSQVARMLRLDEDESVIAAFHGVDPRWRSSGRGRIFRSPTLFEDVVKTVTSCNVSWGGTRLMNRRLCEVIGSAGAFPTPAQLACASPRTLRARCRTGYRDRRLVELGRVFNAAERDGSLAWLEDPRSGEDDIHAFLLTLPGVGPYAAANILQLLGRYARLPMDTEALRHGREVLGFKGSEAAVRRRVQAHFAPMGAHAFRSYWLELWSAYESKEGPAWTWGDPAAAPAVTDTRAPRGRGSTARPAPRARRRGHSPRSTPSPTPCAGTRSRRRR